MTLKKQYDKFTFKEALRVINATKENVKTDTSDKLMGLFEEIIMNLQETYAKPVKLKQYEKIMIDKFIELDTIDVAIVDFGIPRKEHVLLSNETNLIEAFLHPELIEVVE